MLNFPYLCIMKQQQQNNIISKNGLLKVMFPYGFYPFKGKRLDKETIRCEFLSTQYPYVRIALVYDAPSTHKDNVHEIEFSGEEITSFKGFMESIKKIREINNKLKRQCQTTHSKAAHSLEPLTRKADCSSEYTCTKSRDLGILSRHQKDKDYSVRKIMSPLPKPKKFSSM